MGVAVGRLDGQQFFQIVGEAVFLVLVQEDAVEALFQNGEGNVVIDGPGQKQRLLLPVLGQQADALLHGLDGLDAGDLLAPEVHLAAVGLGDAEHGLHDLGAARANQAGQAHDLAGVHVQAHVPEVARAAELVDLQKFATDLGLFLGEELGDLAAHHVVHQDVLLHGHVPGADVLGVAEHGHAVCKAVDVLKAVGNQDDGGALVAQLAGNGVEILALAAGQRGGGLVHDQDLGVHGQRLGDFDQLLRGDRQGAHGDRRAEVRAHGIQQLLCFLVGLVPVDERAALEFVADEDVLGHGQVGIGRCVLVDGRDAVLLGDDGIAHDHLLALQDDLAAVRLMHARQGLDEGGFARAVFAHQRVDLARLQVEAHLVQCLHAREDFRDVIELKYVLRHGITSAFRVFDVEAPLREVPAQPDANIPKDVFHLCKMLTCALRSPFVAFPAIRPKFHGLAC